MKIKEDQIPEFIRNGQDNLVIPILYKKVYPLVENYIVRRSGRKEDASDVFQDALLLFYKQVIKNTFDPKYKVFGYLFRLSLNQWLNKIKKDNKMQPMESLPDIYGEEMQLNKEVLFVKNQPNLLQSMFTDIGEKCIELLTYTIYSDLLMEDIMIRMGFVSESAVKMQQHRCKKKLIELVEKNPGLIDILKGNE